MRSVASLVECLVFILQLHRRRIILDKTKSKDSHNVRYRETRRWIEAEMSKEAAKRHGSDGETEAEYPQQRLWWYQNNRKVRVNTHHTIPTLCNLQALYCALIVLF